MPNLTDIGELTKLLGGTSALLLLGIVALFKVAQELYRSNQGLVGKMMDAAQLRTERETLTHASIEEMRKDMAHGNERILEALLRLAK